MNSSKVLSKIFDDTLKARRKKSSDSSEKREPKIKPSMLGTACMRKLYYSYNRVEEDRAIPIRGLRIMELGNYVGDMFNDVYRESGIQIDYYNEDGTPHHKFPNAPVNYEFPIEAPELDIKSGYIDLVGVVDGKLILGEFKSIGQNGYSNLNQVKPDHLIQGVTYLYAFNKLLREGRYKHIKELDGFERAEGIYFVYLKKDDSSKKEFYVSEADEVFKQIVYKIQAVKDLTAAKQLPQKTPEWCSSCPWEKKCKADFNDI